MKTQFFFLIILILPFSNCKEKKIEAEKIGQEIKDFCAYQSGSWWAYKSSVSGFIDTWKIYDTELGIIGTRRLESKFEFIHLFLVSNLHDSFVYEISPSNLDFVSLKYQGVRELAYYTGESESGPGCEENVLYLVNKDAFNGEIIRKEFDMRPATCHNYFPSQTTWERHIGLKEIIYDNGDTLKLIDYEIKQ